MNQSVKQNSRPSDRYWSDCKVSYMHVNKVATNSVNHAMSHSLGPEDGSCPAMTLQRDSWFIFALVREPWDRLVATFTHNIHQGKLTGPQKRRGFTRDMSLADFIERIVELSDADCDKHFVPQAYRLSDDGNLVPNWIGYLENIEDHWQRLCDDLTIWTGFDCQWPLRWIKKRNHHRRDIGPDLESKELQAMVKERYRRDYEIWYPEYL